MPFPTRTIKQPNPRLLLQRTNLLTHRGLTKMQYLRRLAKAHLLRHCPKHLKPKILQTVSYDEPPQPPHQHKPNR